MTATAPRPDAAPTPHRKAGRLLYLTDDGYTAEPDGSIYPNASDDGYFIAAFADRFDHIELIVPITDGSPTGTDRPAWPRNLTFERLEPYTTFVDFFRSLPATVAHNLPRLWRAVADADQVWLRLPALNGPILYALARIRRRPIGIFVVGNPVAVVETEPDPGRLHPLRRAGARLYWRFVRHVAARHPVMAYGSEIVARLPERAVERGLVTNFFTSLITEEDLVHRPRPKRPAGPLRLVFMGRLSPEKGLGALFDALDGLGDDLEVDCHLLGTGPMRDELQRRADGAGHRVVFHGWVPPGPEQIDLLDRGDVLVLPSRSEGVPKTLLLAMARGIPVLTTDVGGIPDIVDHGRTGLMVRPDDADALGAQLRRLAEDDDLYGRLSTGGLRFVSANTVGTQVERAMTGFGLTD